MRTSPLGVYSASLSGQLRRAGPRPPPIPCLAEQPVRQEGQTTARSNSDGKSAQVFQAAGRTEPHLGSCLVCLIRHGFQRYRGWEFPEPLAVPGVAANFTRGRA